MIRVARGETFFSPQVSELWEHACNFGLKNALAGFDLQLDDDERRSDGRTDGHIYVYIYIYICIRIDMYICIFLLLEKTIYTFFYVCDLCYIGNWWKGVINGICSARHPRKLSKAVAD